MAKIDEAISTILDANAPSFRRRRAISDLGQSNDPRALDAMTRALDDQDRYLRREVVSILSRREDPSVIPLLIKAVRDADDYVQRDAIEALGKVGDHRAIDLLRELTTAGTYSIRSAAERAMGEIERRGISPTTDEPSGQPDETVESETETETEFPKTPLAPVAQSPLADTAAATETPGLPSDDWLVERKPEERPADPITPVEIAEPLGTLAEPDDNPITAVEDQTARPSDEFADLHSYAVEATVGDAEPELQEPVRSEPGIEFISQLSATDETQALDVPAPSAIEQSAVVSAAPVVSAEVVDDEPLPLVSAAECFLIAVPVGFSWDRATRLRQLLGENLAEISPVYEALAELQRQLLQLEQRYQGTFLAFGLQRADKGDDVSRCEEALGTAREHLAQLERAAVRAERERRLLKSQADSMWNQLVGKFQPEHREKIQGSVADIRSTQSELRDKIVAAGEEVQRYAQQLQELQQPIQTLQTQLAELNQQREAAFSSARETNERIDTLILNCLQRLTPTQRQERLEQYAPQAADPAFFEICIGPIMRALSEVNKQIEQLKSIEKQRDVAMDTAQHSLESLGETIGTGFYVGVADRKTKLRLNGSLRVAEQHGLFEGYRGADGWASGTGSGDASYQLEEVIWTSPADLPEAVARFSEAWNHAGRCSAQYQRLENGVEAGRRAAIEYIHFLRTELERDFQEHQS